jgi:hypothetical protein
MKGDEPTIYPSQETGMYMQNIRTHVRCWGDRERLGFGFDFGIKEQVPP